MMALFKLAVSTPGNGFLAGLSSVRCRAIDHTHKFRGETDDKDPRELTYVTFGNADTVALGHGCGSPVQHFGRQQRPSGGLLELKGLEKPFIRVGSHRKGDVEALFECRRLLDTVQPNQYHCRAQGGQRHLFGGATALPDRGKTVSRNA
jgi:hypothetical protein